MPDEKLDRIAALKKQRDRLRAELQRIDAEIARNAEQKHTAQKLEAKRTGKLSN